MTAAMKGAAFTGAAVLIGFALGFGIGQKTRQATASNVKTSYNDGTVTIQADVGSAVKTGVTDYLDDLIG